MVTIGYSKNLLSMRAGARLSDVRDQLSRSFERLSSGQRINRPSDDAASQAISSTLKSTSRQLGQALRNVNDGLSALNIAEGAAQTGSSILQRLRELATQSANGSFSSQQRNALNSEAQALRNEYNRIIASTKFNGRTLLDNLSGTMVINAGSTASDSLYRLNFSNLGTGNFGNGSFAQNVSYDTEGGPSAVRTVDVNTDGILDMVSADEITGTLSVFIGNGDGTFQTRKSYSALASITDLEIGDVNNDGIQDAVVANSNGVGVLLGNADGSFDTAVSFASIGQTASLSLGDVNNDGKLDIVTDGKNGLTARVSILLGNGNGSFGAAVNYTLGGSFIDKPLLSDLNNDGNLDIINAPSTGGAGAIFIRLGNGDGTFQNETNFAAGNPNDLIIGDLNNDGNVDLITSDYDDTYIRVFLGNGNGTFQTALTFESADTDLELALGDVNNDGKLDVLGVGVSNGRYTVLLGNGDGTLGAYSNFTTDFAGADLTLSDMNGDGILDIVSNDPSSHSISVQLGNGYSVSFLNDLDLTSRSGALAAIRSLSTAQDALASSLGVIGSLQSRLNVGQAQLANVREGYQMAESRISDVDVASEVARLTTLRIRESVGSAILSQANQAPQIALSLLKNA